MKINSLHLIILFIILLFATSCKHDHFITDSAYRNIVTARFKIQKKLAKNRSDQLFKVFDQDLSLKEKEALQFLFAFMPLSDLADYDGEFYLKNVRSSFAARDTFSWGREIPEDIFRHFVLPIRVNNENLDSARWVFFMELKDRIKNMSMKDAVLEVNHWCHEKVTYRGTDGRTSAPLATVKTAYGRCGEESTFTVAALRAAGLPARQCYTPRWAHGDDNHAWVEVWVDGKWHYIGACEPEPDLDMAWFTGPAKRAMLVNTNVFGDYQGSEDILVKDTRFTRINVLSNYAETKRIFAKVISSDKKPVDSAAVEFLLYNYAEFYPLTRCYTDKNGLCSFLTGFGDLIVWSAKKDHYGYQKITVKNTDTVIIELTGEQGRESTETFDLVPPPEQKVESVVSDSLRKANSERFAFEDKIRANYEQTFIDSSKSYRLARNLELNPDTLWKLLHKSRGNWRDIIEFISSTPVDLKPWIFPLLFNISDKDLHDVTLDVLSDNITNSWKWEPITKEKGIICQYILSPRVDNENLKPYKSYFQEKFDRSFIEKARKDPSFLTDWVIKNIRIDSNANWGRAPLTPVGSFELKVSDGHSRDIFFVALCRSFGIPARLETATKTPQYFQNNVWVDAWFEKKPEQVSERGTLILSNDEKNERKPEYYIHFTVEKYTDGFYRSLDYETDPVMQSFPSQVKLIPGSYLLVTGNRITGGTVLANLTYFNLEANKTKELTIGLRKDLAPLTVLGTGFDPEKLFHPGDKQTDLLNLKKGVVVAWLEPDKEPSRHFTAELIRKRAEFNSWGGTILILFRNENERNRYLQKNGKDLPKSVLVITFTEASFKYISEVTRRSLGQNLPVIIFVNPKGEIIYLSEGYKIGTGDDLLRCSGR